MLLVSVASFATDPIATAYGHHFGNRNLRFTEAEKVHTEVAVGGHASFGGYISGGAELSATRVYTPTQAFAWRWGGMVGVDYANHYGATSDVLALIGVRLGSTVHVGLDAMAGAGQLSFHDHAWKDEKTHDYYNSLWRFKAGAQLSLGVMVGKQVTLSVWGRYLYAFNNSGNHKVEMPEGWNVTPTQWANNRLAVGLSLSYNIFTETQVSGDNCWQGGAYSGYSFLGNEGWIAGAELLHFNRSGAFGGAVYGLGAYQIFGSDKITTSHIYGQCGYRILPWGASSIVEFEFGAKAGLGEYSKIERGSTESGDFQMAAAAYTLGVEGGAFIGVNFHFGRHQIKITGNFGGHYNFGTSFTGRADYSGKSSNGFGLNASLTAGYAFSF